MKNDSDKALKDIVIIGGGSAGWLVAGLIASEHMSNSSDGVKVTLIESPDVGSIGVGEGTWPTMRETLKKIGIRETEFIVECDASFKQGSQFKGWVDGGADDSYYHPFTLPEGYADINLVEHWQLQRDKVSFADAFNYRGRRCDKGLAPKLITTPEYACIGNYGYHLDAGKFALVLRKHCIAKLGVKHVVDHVTQVNDATNGDIASVSTRENSDIHGDLFVDCSGLASLLLGQHYGVPFISKKDVLFNDTAWAVHLPQADENSSIASHTISTAHEAGGIWDIGLSSRRGVGYTYSSAHISDKEAEKSLRKYIEPTLGESAATIKLRKISFNPGHREKFWHKNCVAIGMASGFLEPLEASALVLVELAAKMISEELPASRAVMDVVAQRYNEKFLYRWERVIDFLKLHYVLSQRNDSSYWKDNRLAETIPKSLQDLLVLWREHPPWHNDFSQVDEIFSAASYQYVLYGMDFETIPRKTKRRSFDAGKAYQLFVENNKKVGDLVSVLPGNRELINKIKEFGLQKI